MSMQTKGDSFHRIGTKDRQHSAMSPRRSFSAPSDGRLLSVPSYSMLEALFLGSQCGAPVDLIAGENQALIVLSTPSMDTHPRTSL